LEQHDLETPLCYSRPYCAIADAPSTDVWCTIWRFIIGFLHYERGQKRESLTFLR
jgi:hypothetical protein